ncbi:MAG: chlorite dismutase family protein [Pyrinomonadaceae bacterium]
MSTETPSRASLRLAAKSPTPKAGEQRDNQLDIQPMPRQFVNFSFYKVNPAWRLLDEETRRKGRTEFIEALKNARKDLMIHTYSLVGLRANADLMVWRIGYSLDAIQEMTANINRSGLGKYLEVSQSFLSMTKRSMYIDKENPEHDEDRLHIIPGKSKYLFVYPFVKTRNWYMTSYDERQEMMDEHIRIGMKYRSVKLHTTYSFGLDDQEFVVAFETEQPADFLDLVQELRESKASSFTLRDTPMYTCSQRTVEECLDELG